MEFQFKNQQYQTNAVNAIVDCFFGQPNNSSIRNRIYGSTDLQFSEFDEFFKNLNVCLTDDQILTNIQTVQKRQNLQISKSLHDFVEVNGAGKIKSKPISYKPGAKINLDIEMETGTGKTYCYIKTIFELNQRFGWSKFIVMVPSIAIREGVYKSFQITTRHFAQNYGKKARFFIYNSKYLNELEYFSSDSNINVMIINIQAFNAKGADNRRIYDELDDFQSRRPIDIISSTRPILILDEPQKMEGRATLNALPKFNPLFILRYSATHRTNHLKVYRLDALDAYNQKLVKKIQVRGIQTRGLAGGHSYIYLEKIEISKQAIVARVELEMKLNSGDIRRKIKMLKFQDDLFVVSNGLDQYRGFTISQIDFVQDKVEFTNGIVLAAGEAIGNLEESDIRRLQIRETIKAHFDKERQLLKKK